MRIVFLNQFFWPDAIATGQLLTDLAVAAAVDHEVTVICGGVGVRESDDRQNGRPAVKILRTKNFRFGHGITNRLASYLTYTIGSVIFGLFCRKPDCFVTLTTPPIVPVIGSLLSSFRSSHHVIWEMDVYPDIATDLQVLKKNGVIERVFGFLLDWSRKRANAVIVLGNDMRARLIARGVPENKIHVAENWADGEEITPKFLSSGQLVIQYSGNLGLAHEVGTLIEVISKLRNCAELQFVFIGGGPRRKAIEDFCSRNAIRNVSFRPYCKRDELSSSLSESHVGLVTQLPETIGSIVPSKIYGIMAAGRPLLYIGPEGSTPARHIAQFKCGWHIRTGDVGGLEKLLKSLAEDRRPISEFGSNARKAFEQHFDRVSGVTRVMNILQNQYSPEKRLETFAQVMRGDPS